MDHQQQMEVVGIKIKVEVTLLVELLYERERERMATRYNNKTP